MCDGTGQHGESPCEQCNGTGILEIYIHDDLENRITDILEADYINNRIPTYQIIESTAASEYNALSDANKDAYRQIVSCGVVDLSEGTGIRTKLWNMFDEESETRTALITLLGE
jgi:hypothetical protein